MTVSKELTEAHETKTEYLSACATCRGAILSIALLLRGGALASPLNRAVAACADQQIGQCMLPSGMHGFPEAAGEQRGGTERGSFRAW